MKPEVSFERIKAVPMRTPFTRCGSSRTSCGVATPDSLTIIDARGAVSATERVALIKRVRDLAVACAEAYVASREKHGYPLLGANREGSADGQG